MTTDRATLLGLAARVEAASEPDFALGVEVLRAVGRTGIEVNPLFSIDAALSLVGSAWEMHRQRSPDMGGKDWHATIGWTRQVRGKARTPALALTAAALRALAQEATSDG